MAKKGKMDGARIREFLSQDIKALLTTYRQFESLIPHPKHSGAAHPGEDGRYIEALLRSYLKEYLPQSLEVSTGFILRPAVKTGKNGRERREEKDSHSTQLDIIIHDSVNFPVFQRFEDNVVVPPESVVAIISVKKHLRPGNVLMESKALRDAANLCRCLNADSENIRGPYLALVSMGFGGPKTKSDLSDVIWKEIQEAYPTIEQTFDEVIGYIAVLGVGSAFKARPIGNPPKKARFVWHDHVDADFHLGLQFILTGILSVFYDSSRNWRRRPGFTGFESGRPHEKTLGDITVSGLM